MRHLHLAHSNESCAPHLNWSTPLILPCRDAHQMYKRTQDYLEDVGIGPVEMEKLLKDIHLHSVDYLHNIVVQRCKLDSEAL